MMLRGGIHVVEMFLLTVIISVVGRDLTTPDATTSLNSTTAGATTASLVASRRGIVHCAISLGAADEPSKTRLDAAANISGSGCDDADAVTSLALKAAAGEAADVDLLPVCRFSNVRWLTVVGPLLNKSVTSLYCFRNIRHVTLQRAEIDVVRQSLIRDSFRSRDFRSVEVSDSGVEELAADVFDGRRMQHLEEVNLSTNRLTKIVNGSFVNLAALIALNLSQNAIRSVEPHAFVNIHARYSDAVITSTIRLRFDGRSTAYQRSLRSH